MLTAKQTWATVRLRRASGRTSIGDKGLKVLPVAALRGFYGGVGQLLPVARTSSMSVPPSTTNPAAPSYLSTYCEKAIAVDKPGISIARQEPGACSVGTT